MGLGSLAGGAPASPTLWTLDLLNDSLAPGVFIPPLCSAPAGAVYAPTSHRLYVAGYGSLNLCVVNLTSGLESTVSLPTDQGGALGDPVAVAFDPANGDLYVANSGLDSTTVTVVNATTDGVVAEVSAGFSPDAIAYDSANGYLYVADGVGGVSIINGSDNAAVGAAVLPGEPDAVAFDPANRDVYVANLDSTNVSVLNGSTERWVANITVGPIAGGILGPDALAYDAASGDVYVADSDSATIVGIGGSPGRVVASITIGAAAGDALIADPVGNDLFVDVPRAPSGNFSVACVVNTTSRQVVANLTLGLGGGGVWAEDGVTGEIFAPDADSGNVSVLSGGSVRVVGSIALEAFPATSTFDPANGELYLSDGVSNSLTAVSGRNDSISARIDLGGNVPSLAGPPTLGLAVDPANNDLFVASGLGVGVVNTTLDRLTATIPVAPPNGTVGGAGAGGIVYDPSDGLLLATMSYGNAPMNYLAAINGTSNTVASYVEFNSSTGVITFDVAYSPVTRDVYVLFAQYSPGSTPGPAAVAVLNGTTLGIRAVVGLGGSCTAALGSLGVDDRNGNVFAACSSTVSLLSGSTNRVLSNLTLPGPPGGFAFDPATASMYAADAEAGFLVQAPFGADDASVLNGSTGAVEATVPLGSGPMSVAYDPRNANIYLAEEGASSLTILPTDPSEGPRVLVQAAPTPVPVNFTLNLTVATSGGAGNDSFGYRGLPSGCASVNAPSLACRPGTVGVYPVIVTVMDSLGDLAGGSVAVDVIPALYSVAVSPASGSVYVGSPLALTAAADCAGGPCAGVTNYTWTINDTLARLSRSYGGSVNLTAGMRAGALSVSLLARDGPISLTAFASIAVLYPNLTSLTIAASATTVAEGGSVGLSLATSCAPVACPTLDEVFSWGTDPVGLGTLNASNASQVTFHAGSGSGRVTITGQVTLGNRSRNSTVTLQIAAPSSGTPPALAGVGTDTILSLIALLGLLVLAAWAYARRKRHDRA